MMVSHVKRWRIHPLATTRFAPRLDALAVYTGISPATACRLVFVARPPLPRAPLLRRHYLPDCYYGPMRMSCGLQPFDLSLVGTGLRRLCHPRLVHRTVLALTLWPLPKVSCPLRRVLAWCMWSISSQATAAFANKRRLGALQVLPQTTPRGHFSTLQAFSSITTLSFTRPPGRSRSYTRRGLCHSSLLGIRFLVPKSSQLPG